MLATCRSHRDRRATGRPGRRPLARRIRARAEPLAAGVGELAIALQHEINNPLASSSRTLAAADIDDTLPDDASTVEILLTEARRIASVVKR